MLEIDIIILSLVGGAFAGTLNTLAGFGSIITIAIYMDFIGLAGNVANATNRINVLASSSISTYNFNQNGKLNLLRDRWIILIVALGAIVGVIMAGQLSSEGFKQFFKYLLIPVLFILLANPKRFIKPDQASPPISNWINFPLLFLFGVYAGFIQVGFGVFFLIVLVMFAKYPLIESNGLKVAIIAIYTIFALLYFHFQGLVNWQAGLFMAIGQAIGGYISSKYASKSEKANQYAYYLLITIVIFAILKYFGFLSIMGL